MSKLLYIKASPRVERSKSAAVADAFIQAYQRKNPDGQLGATYFIPAVIVPALLVAHFMIFVLLLRTERTSCLGKERL